MTKVKAFLAVPALAALFLMSTADCAPAAGKTRMGATCKTCHQDDGQTLWGFMKGGSQGETAFQVQVDGDTWDITYDSSTKLAKNLTTVRELANEKIIMVKFKEEKGKNVASEVSYKTPMAFTKPELVIEPGDLAALLKKDPKEANYAVLDVRGVSNYEEAHLPGAVVVPNYRFAKYKDRLPKDKNTLVVLYCNGYTCSMSPSMYRVLTEGYGYTNVKMFAAGFPAWQSTGQPVHTEPEFLKYLQENGKPDSYVLVDLRSPDTARREHIPNAVNLPASDMESAYQALPTDKKTRIILYADTMTEAESAQRTLRVNAYDVVSVLHGGIAAWKAKGYPVASDALLAKITYTPQTLPGRISVDEFRTIIKEAPADKLIVDVRRPDERASKGKIPGAINIPVDTLDWRWTELPKEKEVIIHCQDGPRASVAYDVLKEHGVKARFLFAGFKWNKDGSYEIQAK